MTQTASSTDPKVLVQRLLAPIAVWVMHPAVRIFLPEAI